MKKSEFQEQSDCPELFLPMRLDKYIIEFMPSLTRNQLSQRVGLILLNGKKAKLSSKVVANDQIEIELAPPPTTDINPEKIDLSFIYQDENTLVVNKPQGMVVHPGAGNSDGTLVNALLGSGLLATEWDNSNIENYRPGIVHRLDKDTSGLILVARNIESHAYYSSLFKKRRIDKWYLAIVKGILPQQAGSIISNIVRDRNSRKKFMVAKGRGKEAHTDYKVLAQSQTHSLLELHLHTGRTHQIRVHLTSIGTPIVGDPIYSRRENNLHDYSLMLHAWKLSFSSYLKKDRIELKAPLPHHFTSCMKELGLKVNLR